MQILQEGLRMIASRYRKPLTCSGTPEEICRQIVDACWTGKFYQTSLRNYTGYYSRDFGMCIKALLYLKKEKEAEKTLRYALQHYVRVKRVTQQISKKGKPFDFPSWPSDALAYLLYSLHAINNKSLIEEYRPLLESEIERYNALLEDGLLKHDIRLAGMRDHAKRVCGCYENTMIAAIQKFSRKLKLKNTNTHNYPKLLKEIFWTGTHFKDDVNSSTITGDANIAPLWFGIITDKKMVRTVLSSLKKNKLVLPAARYETAATTKMDWYNIFAPGWEQHTVWLHLGNMYLDVIYKHDRAAWRKEIALQEKLIKKFKGYPELLDKNRLYTSFFFRADTTMLWAANFLKHKALIRKA